MTTATDQVIRTTKPPRSTRLTRSRFLLLAAGLIAAMSAVRVITGATDLTSKGAVSATLVSTVPILLAGLGGLWSERAGVVNVGLEGMMILGTWFGAWAGFTWNPWVGVLAAVVGGALGGLLHAIATVGFGVDHIVSGVAINLLAAGVARFLATIVWEGKAGGGGSTQSPQVGSISTVSIPGVDSLLRPLEDRHWFFVSDLSGILRGTLTDISPVTVLALLMVPLTWFLLWRTAFGLRLRSCGENPSSAESLGVNVYAMKTVAVLVSGGLAGLAGGFLSLVASSIYREGQTAGRGFIGLAAMIFGNWRPSGTLGGAALFGYTDTLQLRADSSIHALLLFVTIALIAYAVFQIIRRKPVPAAVTAVAGGLFLVWFTTSSSVNPQFTGMAPYVTTLLVLSLFSQRLRMPAADGLPYRRGQAK
ncbi:MAG: ABC transporter permease [Actinomycetes bacterium]